MCALRNTDVKTSDSVYTQELHDELIKGGYDVIDECVVQKLSLENPPGLYMQGTQMSWPAQLSRACLDFRSTCR